MRISKLLSISAALALSVVGRAAAVPFPPSSASTPAIDPIANYYQKHATNVSCGIGDCGIQFPAITETRVLVTHVSCRFILVSPGTVTSAELTTPNFASSTQLQVFQFAAGGINYAINAETYEFFDKGTQPRIDVVSTGEPIELLDCTIFGYHD